MNSMTLPGSDPPFWTHVPRLHPRRIGGHDRHRGPRGGHWAAAARAHAGLARRRRGGPGRFHRAVRGPLHRDDARGSDPRGDLPRYGGTGPVVAAAEGAGTTVARAAG